MKKVSIDIVPGFGNAHIKKLQAQLKKNFPECTIRIIRNVPRKDGVSNPAELVQQVEREIFDGNMDEKRILVGESYGGLVLLAAVLNTAQEVPSDLENTLLQLRRKLARVIQVICIDAPLRSDIEVPETEAFEKKFAEHYSYRSKMATDCEAKLKLLDEKMIAKFIAIGGMDDPIVPPDAKFFKENFQEISLNSKNQFLAQTEINPEGESIMSKDHAKNIQLQYINGHDVDDKLDEITALVKWSLQNIMSSKGYRIGVF